MGKVRERELKTAHRGRMMSVRQFGFAYTQLRAEWVPPGGAARGNTHAAVAPLMGLHGPALAPRSGIFCHGTGMCAKC